MYFVMIWLVCHQTTPASLGLGAQACTTMGREARLLARAGSCTWSRELEIRLGRSVDKNDRAWHGLVRQSNRSTPPPLAPECPWAPPSQHIMSYWPFSR